MYENNRKKEEMNVRREGDVCSSKKKKYMEAYTNKKKQFEEGIYAKEKYK